MFDSEELEWRLERLVDGELPETERTELLRQLDEIPEGWKRCACAFLRAQCYQETLECWDSEEAGFEDAEVERLSGEFAQDESFRQWVRERCEQIVANGEAAVESTAPLNSVMGTNEAKVPVVVAALREGGVVAAREPVWGEEHPGRVSRMVSGVRRYALRHVSVWGSVAALIAVSFLLGSLATRSPIRLPQSSTDQTELAARLAESRTAVTLNEESVLSSQESVVPQANPSEIATGGTLADSVIADATEDTQDGYLTLESDLVFESYRDGDTVKLVAVFDGEQNPESLQNTFILSDEKVAILRGAGYDVEQQQDVVMHESANGASGGYYAMSAIPVSRTQIRFVGISD